MIFCCSSPRTQPGTNETPSPLSTKTKTVEVMSAAQIAIIGGLPYTALRDAILAHPTFVEGLNMLFGSEPTLSKAAKANN